MSEISDTAALVKLGGEGTYYLLKGSVKGILYLYQTIKKLEAARILGKGEVRNFERFLKATEGKYKILNVPTEDPQEIANMREDLDRLHAAYTVLPDLNVGDGQIQVAYALEDMEKVEGWYRSFCLDRLQPGGEKEYQDLLHLTDGQVSIVNIPWPDSAGELDEYAYADTAQEGLRETLGLPFQEGEPRPGIRDIRKLKEDLDKLHVNYTILPDLNVGDGYIQAAFAAADAPRVRAWYEACQKDLLALGKSVGDMKEFSFEDYLGTSPKEESAVKKEQTAKPAPSPEPVKAVKTAEKTMAAPKL